MSTSEPAREVDDPAAVEEQARELRAAAVEAAVRAETAREAAVRASRLGDDLLAGAGVPAHVRRPPLRTRYPRWGWRAAIR
ncbi:MAG: hypothetical protein ACLFUG_07150, partial [Nitriliruptoraceae bacterium]